MGLPTLTATPLQWLSLPRWLSKLTSTSQKAPKSLTRNPVPAPTPAPRNPARARATASSERPRGPPRPLESSEQTEEENKALRAVKDEAKVWRPKAGVEQRKRKTRPCVRLRNEIPRPASRRR